MLWIYIIMFRVQPRSVDSRTLGFWNTVTIWIPSTWAPDSSEYLTVWVSNIRTVWVSGFKWLSQVTWRTIQILSILDNKQAYFSPVLRPPFEYWTVWQSDTKLPFAYQSSPVFRWLLYGLFVFSVRFWLIKVIWLSRTLTKQTNFYIWILD